MEELILLTLRTDELEDSLKELTRHPQVKSRLYVTASCVHLGLGSHCGDHCCHSASGGYHDVCLLLDSLHLEIQGHLQEAGQSLQCSTAPVATVVATIVVLSLLCDLSSLVRMPGQPCNAVILLLLQLSLLPLCYCHYCATCRYCYKCQVSAATHAPHV